MEEFREQLPSVSHLCSKVNQNVTKRDKAILDKIDCIIVNRKYDLCMILCGYVVIKLFIPKETPYILCTFNHVLVSYHYVYKDIDSSNKVDSS